MRAALLLLALCAGCGTMDPARAPGCHYVACGDGLLIMPKGFWCGVFVGDAYDGGRLIGKFGSGEEAIAFIKDHSLHTCEVKP